MSTDNFLSVKIGGVAKRHKRFEALKIMALSIVGIVFAVVIFSFYYLYQNIFNTYNDFSAIASFKTIARVEVIDKKVFEETKKIKMLKQDGIFVPLFLRNIFVYKEIATTTPTTITPKVIKVK